MGKSFIESNRYEIVMPFEGEEPINRIFQQEKPALVLFSDKSDVMEETFRNFAMRNRNRIVFTQSRTNDGLGQRLAEYIGVTTEQAPCVRLIHPTGGDMSKFVFEGEVTEASLESFMARYESGNLERSYKSAEAPATNDEPVKVVVGTTFDEMVINSGKD